MSRWSIGYDDELRMKMWGSSGSVYSRMKQLTVECFALLLTRIGVRHQRQNSIYYQFAVYPTRAHLEHIRKEGGEVHPTWLINVVAGFNPVCHKLDARDVTDKRPKVWLFAVIKKKEQRVQFNGILTPALLSGVWDGTMPKDKKIAIAAWDLVELDEFVPLIQCTDEVEEAQ